MNSFEQPCTFNKFLRMSGVGLKFNLGKNLLKTTKITLPGIAMQRQSSNQHLAYGCWYDFTLYATKKIMKHV